MLIVGLSFFFDTPLLFSFWLYLIETLKQAQFIFLKNLS